MTPTITYYPLNYGLSQDSWSIFDPSPGNVGDGAFVPNHAYGPKDIADGLAHTLAVAEVKAYQPNVWDTNKPDTIGIVAPSTPADLQAYVGGTLDENGHTEWVEGDVHETGSTTTFTPNEHVPHTDGGITYDIGLTSMRDGESIMEPTCAAVTARSYHPGVVNALYMDGSVHTIDDLIDLRVWRALETSAGNEIIKLPE